MKTKSWMTCLTTIVVDKLICGMLIGLVSMNIAHALPGEEIPEQMWTIPKVMDIVHHDSESALKTVVKLQKQAAKSLKSKARQKAYARVSAAAELSVTPPALLNGDFELVAPASVLARNWVEGNDCMDASWGTYQLATQTDASRKSNRMMQLTGGTNSAYGCQILNLNQDVSRPIFVGGWMKGQSIARKGKASNYGAYIGAYFVLQDGSAVECYNTLPNTGTFPWRWVGINSYSDCGIRQPIVLVAVLPRLVSSYGAAFVDNIKILDKELTDGPPTGQVTLTFDDGYDSDYSIVRPILNAHNLPATAALISSTAGIYGGTVTYDQAYALIKSGWDMQSHSINHPNLTLLSATDAKKELTESQSTIRAGLSAAATAQGDSFDANTQANHFIWPLSALNAQTVGWAQANYQSGRTVFGGLNGYGLYPWMVYSWSMDSATSLADIQNWLDDACTNKRWLILTAHRIGDPIPGQESYYVNTADYLNSVAQLIENEVAHCPTPFHAVNYSTGFNNFTAAPSNKPSIP